jgi:hypothetical protein
LIEKKKLRNVPGWKLSWGLFDKLLLGFCYVHKSPPFRLRLMKFPAWIYIVSGTGKCRKVQTSDISAWALEVAVILQPRKKLGITPRDLWDSLPATTDGGSLIVDSLEDRSEEKHSWINPEWWTVHSWAFPPSEEIKHCCLRDH